MIGESFSYNNKDIVVATGEYQIVADVEWRKITSSDETQRIDGRHGVRLSPTFQRGRKIQINGMILTESRVGASKAMDYLDKLFALQEQGGKTEFNPFIITDEQGRAREIPVKIKTPIEYDTDEYDYIDGDGRTFRVTLEAEDGRLFSTTTIMNEGSESVFGGFTLGVQLGAAMNVLSSGIVCRGDGNIESPAKIVLDVKQTLESPLTIRRMKRFFALDITATAGDTIIIDSKNRTATKNGNNILSKRMVGSQRPTIKGDTAFSITSKNGGLSSSAFGIKVYFANVLL